MKIPRRQSASSRDSSVDSEVARQEKTNKGKPRKSRPMYDRTPSMDDSPLNYDDYPMSPPPIPDKNVTQRNRKVHKNSRPISPKQSILERYTKELQDNVLTPPSSIESAELSAMKNRGSTDHRKRLKSGSKLDGGQIPPGSSDIHNPLGLEIVTAGTEQTEKLNPLGIEIVTAGTTDICDLPKRQRRKSGPRKRRSSGGVTSDGEELLAEPYQHDISGTVEDAFSTHDNSFETTGDIQDEIQSLVFQTIEHISGKGSPPRRPRSKSGDRKKSRSKSRDRGNALEDVSSRHSFGFETSNSETSKPNQKKEPHKSGQKQHKGDDDAGSTEGFMGFQPLLQEPESTPEETPDASPPQDAALLPDSSSHAHSAEHPSHTEFPPTPDELPMKTVPYSPGPDFPLGSPPPVPVRTSITPPKPSPHSHKKIKNPTGYASAFEAFLKETSNFIMDTIDKGDKDYSDNKEREGEQSEVENEALSRKSCPAKVKEDADNVFPKKKVYDRKNKTKIAHDSGIDSARSCPPKIKLDAKSKKSNREKSPQKGDKLAKSPQAIEKKLDMLSNKVPSIKDLYEEGRAKSQEEHIAKIMDLKDRLPALRDIQRHDFNRMNVIPIVTLERVNLDRVSKIITSIHDSPSKKLQVAKKPVPAEMPEDDIPSVREDRGVPAPDMSPSDSCSSPEHDLPEPNIIPPSPQQGQERGRKRHKTGFVKPGPKSAVHKKGLGESSSSLLQAAVKGKGVTFIPEDVSNFYSPDYDLFSPEATPNFMSPTRTDPQVASTTNQQPGHVYSAISTDNLSSSSGSNNGDDTPDSASVYSETSSVQDVDEPGTSYGGE